MSDFDPTILPSTSDRRRVVRHRSTADLLTSVIVRNPDGSSGEPVATCIIDYSLLGLGMIHPVELNPGQEFYLEMEGSRGRPAHRRLMRCSRCSSMDGGRYLIGAEYLS